MFHCDMRVFLHSHCTPTELYVGARFHGGADNNYSLQYVANLNAYRWAPAPEPPLSFGGATTREMRSVLPSKYFWKVKLGKAAFQIMRLENDIVCNQFPLSFCV